MGKKGSILMVTLWILAILVVFAIGLGQRTSISLRLARFQRDRLKAGCLAKAGIARAVLVIEKDDPAYDSLKDKWADNEDVFKKIALNENQDEFARVSYIDAQGETKFGVTDEERKININTANTQLLEQLFILKGYQEDASGLAALIVNWINSASEPEDTRKIFKNEPLKTPEELLLILDYFYEKRQEANESRKAAQEVFNQVKGLITVYAEGKVNINTAPLEVLKIIFLAAGNDQSIQATPAEVEDLVARIDAYRKGGIGYFTVNDMNADTIKTNLELGGAINNQARIIERLISAQVLIAVSGNFRIEAIGNVGQVRKKISAVVKRNPTEIAYWHEN